MARSSPTPRDSGCTLALMRRSLLIAMALLCWLVPASTASAVTLSGSGDSDDLVVVRGALERQRGRVVGQHRRERVVEAHDLLGAEEVQ